MLTDIGLGKRIASMIAKRIVPLLAEAGEKPDALLMSRERYTAHESVSQGALMLDGSEGASVQFAPCCRPIPGDGILGYLGRGEGLVVHTDDCIVAKRLQSRDSERFIAVEWSDEPVRAFETNLLVTISNGKGVLARVAAALAGAEATSPMSTWARSGHRTRPNCVLASRCATACILHPCCEASNGHRRFCECSAPNQAPEQLPGSGQSV